MQIVLKRLDTIIKRKNDGHIVQIYCFVSILVWFINFSILFNTKAILLEEQ